MSLEIGPQLPPVAFGARPVPTTASAPPAPARHPAGDVLKAAFEVDTVELIPLSPPLEVSEEVELAAQRAARLAADDRELHFAVDEETGRVVVQVRDLQGTVIRTIPPSEALGVMSGAMGI